MIYIHSSSHLTDLAHENNNFNIFLNVNIAGLRSTNMAYV